MANTLLYLEIGREKPPVYAARAENSTLRKKKPKRKFQLFSIAKLMTCMHENFMPYLTT